MVLDGAENPLDIPACYCILICYAYLRVKRNRPAPGGAGAEKVRLAPAFVVRVMGASEGGP
jgi:hypothetical protein